MHQTILVLIVCAVVPCQSYVVPEPEITVYRQRGFSVSIPHAPGIRIFGFHANINREITDSQTGEISRDIAIHGNGKWTFYDRRNKLNIGDTIHYWLYVQKHGMDYKFINGRFTVKELIENPLIRNAGKASHYTGADETSSAKTLTLSGRIPLDGFALSTVAFVLKEKLDIDPVIVAAQRNSDGSITFEVPSIQDKSNILAAAKSGFSAGTKINIQ
uniref:CBM39 domain-containing protein n=1 Tax=Photinus pyralis TaxID=7054 RepID=A0A1Y1KMT4_PHOPY